jgi:hypothetical protein
MEPTAKGGVDAVAERVVFLVGEFDFTGIFGLGRHGDPLSFLQLVYRLSEFFDIPSIAQFGVFVKTEDAFGV